MENHRSFAAKPKRKFLSFQPPPPWMPNRSFGSILEEGYSAVKRYNIYKKFGQKIVYYSRITILYGRKNKIKNLDIPSLTKHNTDAEYK